VAGGLERGEIRLFRFPPPDKARPVLLLTTTAAIRYLSRVTVAPITSTIRGVPSEVTLGFEEGLRQECAVNLHNLITVPKEAIGPVVARLGDERMRQVCGAIGFALGCDG
jgi:mRNA interferase MazF